MEIALSYRFIIQLLGFMYFCSYYELAMLLGYRIHFLKIKKTPLNVNLMPVGIAYVAYQSNPHPIVGQTEDRPIYFGKIQLGIRF